MKSLMFLVIFMPSLSFAAEGSMCSFGYEAVQRAVNNMSSNKGQVSLLAKDEVFKNLKNSLSWCLTECEGKKFDFCNSVAKDFESK